MKPKKYKMMKKYLNLINKKFLLYAGILLMVFPSCSEDVLNETPLDFLAPEKIGRAHV